MKQLMHPCVYFTANKAAEIALHTRATAQVSLEKVIHDIVISFCETKADKATH